jgi:uncharacterized membrane protein YdjX (TVP38/TMEM64 family)
MVQANQGLRRRTANRRRLGVLALLIAVGVVVAASARLHHLSEAAVTALASLISRHPGWGVLAFVGLAALSAMLAFISSVVIVPVAVHHWGPVITALLLWIGWLAGGVGGYTIGRYLGRPVVRRLVGRTRVQYFEQQITARTPFLVVFFFQLALQSEIPAYVMGMVRYPVLRYLLALSAAELPIAVGAVILGSGFLNRQYWLMVGIGLTGIAGVSLAVRALHRRLSNAREGSFELASSMSAKPPVKS